MAADSTETEFKAYTECESAKVTGVITDVSDMTPTKKGFHATLNDGNNETRVVGFRKRQRDILKQFEDTGDTL